PPAGGPYSFVGLTNPGAGNPIGAIQLTGPDVATLGTNRYPGLAPVQTNPSALLPITAKATSGGAFVCDTAALQSLQLLSASSFALLAQSGTLLIDLSGSGLPSNPPGAVFVTNNADGTRSTSRSGS